MTVFLCYAGCFIREIVDLVGFGVVIAALSLPRPSSVSLVAWPKILG